MKTRRFFIVITSLLVVISIGLFLFPSSAYADVVHTVRWRETLYRIATRYGVTIQAIVQTNNIPNRNLIYVGQQLVIPGEPGPQPTSAPTAAPGTSPATYVVKRGDTLNRIALRYGVTIWTIAQANNIANPNLIYVGQRLTIPSGSDPAPTSTPPPPPASGGGNLRYGVQAHMVHNDQAGRVVQTTKEVGFSWVKQQVEWKIFEQNRAQYDWGSLDHIADTAAANGVSLFFSVVGTPPWARKTGANLSVDGPPANYGDYADFVAKLAARYRGRVQAYEIWNEPNLHYAWGNESLSAWNYIQLLKASYNAINGVCPECIVVSAGLTPTGVNDGVTAVDDFVYLEQMYNFGLRGVSDAIGVHASGYNLPPDRYGENSCDPGFIFRGPCDTPHHSWSFRSTMEGYRNIMVSRGDGGKKLWVTEFGWASNPNPVPGYEYAADNSLQEQADFTVRALQMMKNWGWVGAALVWNLNFRVVAPGSEQAQWGMVDEGWNPLPIFHAVKAMPK